MPLFCVMRLIVAQGSVHVLYGWELRTPLRRGETTLITVTLARSLGDRLVLFSGTGLPVLRVPYYFPEAVPGMASACTVSVE
ncbi:hypothetical protein [Microtetraspora malaysiensis]|uniref:hypothetical protein n=1 Tax=Microtetraspora malaysiensis TaxID=161358 RepID=UPI003D8D8DF2